MDNLPVSVSLVSFCVLVGIDERQEAADVQRFDRPGGRHGEKDAGLRAPKSNVAGPVLPISDTEGIREHLQILNPPVARIIPHLGRNLGNNILDIPTTEILHL